MICLTERKGYPLLAFHISIESQFGERGKALGDIIKSLGNAEEQPSAGGNY